MDKRGDNGLGLKLLSFNGPSTTHSKILPSNWPSTTHSSRLLISNCGSWNARIVAFFLHAEFNYVSSLLCTCK